MGLSSLIILLSFLKCSCFNTSCHFGRLYFNSICLYLVYCFSAVLVFKIETDFSAGIGDYKQIWLKYPCSTGLELESLKWKLDFDFLEMEMDGKKYLIIWLSKWASICAYICLSCQMWGSSQAYHSVNQHTQCTCVGFYDNTISQQKTPMILVEIAVSWTSTGICKVSLECFIM